MIVISVKDDITPFISDWLAKMPTWKKRLSRALGWYSQKRVKELSNNPVITTSYQERVPYWVRNALDYEHKAPKMWWGKLRQAIGYQATDSFTLLGWTSKASAFDGRVQEEGTSRSVTPQLRRYYIARGLYVRKEVINVPARPLFNPAMQVVQPEFGSFMHRKVTDYISGVIYAGVRKSKRKYYVY